MKKGESENIAVKTTTESNKSENKTPTTLKDSISPEDLIKSENFTLQEDNEREDEKDYSTAAYYYYMKSERHKQNGETASAIEALQQAIEIDPGSVYLKKNLIVLYIMNKDNLGAMRVAEEMYQKSPNNQEILAVLAKLKLQLNQINEAQTLYQRLIKINPQNHDAYILLGNIYMSNQRNEDAFTLFSKMAKRFPESYGAHFFLGKLHSQKKNFAQAEKEFLKSIELRGDLVEPRFELIAIYKARERTKSGKALQKNYRQKILSLYQEIINMDNSNIKAAIELPLYLYKNGEKAKASQMLVDFGQRYHNDDAVMVAMAKELISNENKNDAVIVFNEILKENLNSSAADSTGNYDKSVIHYLAGLTFDSLKESQRAIDHLLKVSSGSEQYKKSIFHIAYIYSQSGESKKSIEFLESKLIELPGDTELIGYLSAFYEDNNQLEKALDLLKQGLKIAPNDVELLFRSGVILDKSGDKDGSMAAMKKVIELDSEHASALNYLGYTYADLGIKLDEAEDLIKRSLALKPDDGYITDSLGWVYYKKGEYDKAIESLERAVSLSSGDPVIAEHLGDAYREKKMYSKALEAYKNALSKNKDAQNRVIIEKKINEIMGQIK
ncbi:MAG: tetratricopeptide repeat protein [Desulfamplus sp.]|nr:tetratricopeptide repeat protein [Desulfamplus sp.]